MSGWKQAPVPESEEPGLFGFMPDLSGPAYFDQWEYITVLGIDIPTAALALPVAVFGLYQVFMALRRSHLKRPGTAVEDMHYEDD